MKRVLVIPVRIDALVAESEQDWLAPTTDFTRLPYVADGIGVNVGTPNLSEEVVSPPFQLRGDALAAGIHLHWALPEALCHGESGTDPETGEPTTNFEAVPNRWLVTRRRRVDSTAREREASWVVESDYLWPDGEGFTSGSVAYPVQPDLAAGHEHPFRFLGRSRPFAEYGPTNPEDEYLDRLTCVGFGEPSFASFYPNCRGVFGFHDTEIDAAELGELSYDLLGWFSDPIEDRYHRFADETLTELTTAGVTGDALLSAFRTELDEVLGWDLHDAPTPSNDLTADDFPSVSLFHGRIDFEPGDDLRHPKQKRPERVAIGNTASEALATFVASTLADRGGLDASGAQRVEQQLNALQFSEQLDHLELDLGSTLKEVCHSGGFHAVDGGRLWTIRMDRPAEQPAAQTEEPITSWSVPKMAAPLDLPAELAQQLNQVNTLQRQYEHTNALAASARRRLFADWYRYAVVGAASLVDAARYPAKAEIGRFMESSDLALLKQLEESAGRLHLDQDQVKGHVHGGRSSEGNPSSLATLLAAAVNALTASLEQANEGRDAVFRLAVVPAPRWWQPREPVVLFCGPGVSSNERHGQSMAGIKLNVGWSTKIEASIDEAIRAGGESLFDSVDEFQHSNDGFGPESHGVMTWRHQPWHPFMLGWKVAVVPKIHANEYTGDYDTDVITSSYDLPDDVGDLQPRNDERQFAARRYRQREAVYQGLTTLTPQAGHTLRHKLEMYLRAEMRSSGFFDFSIPLDDRRGLNEALYRYEEHELGRDPSSAISQYLLAFRLLQEPECQVLSQALSGFNEALLSHKQTLQMPIAVAAGEPPDDLTQQVASTLAGHHLIAPLPTNDFYPIRSGDLQLLRLQLIDTFGQTRDVFDVGQTGAWTSAMTSSQLQHPSTGSHQQVTLPPRIVQPARLDFRWISAADDQAEMNAHPASSPVCGWLLTNYLDNSLWVYEHDGNAVGVIDQLGRWRAAPGHAGGSSPSELANPHLRQLVVYVLEHGPAFLEVFISSVNAALGQIEPAGDAVHQARSLLVGRPVAVVRASLDLNLLGAPAVDQSWPAFADDLRQSTEPTPGAQPRSTKRFEEAQFPIRIGEPGRLGDGLVGLWVEHEGGYRSQTFYAISGETGVHDLIAPPAAGSSAQLHVTAADAASTILMLVDPRAPVHATSGILPTKSISLPRDQVASALADIEVAFFTAPILSDTDHVRLPLPSDPGAHWSWLEEADGVWTEEEVSAAAGAEYARWGGTLRLREGWLALRTADTKSKDTT